VIFYLHLQKQRTHTELKIHPNLKLRNLIIASRNVAEQCQLIGSINTTTETSESSDQTPYQSRSESFSFSTHFPAKAVLLGFKELMADTVQFQEDFSRIILDSFKEDSQNTRNEIRQIVFTSQNKSPIVTPQLNGKKENGEPLISTSTLITAIRDDKVRNILNKNFPGSQIVTWNYMDVEGSIEGNPENISVDFILTKDNIYHLLHITEKVGTEELESILKIGKLFSSQFPQITLGCVLITSKASAQASMVADACKIRLLMIR